MPSTVKEKGCERVRQVRGGVSRRCLLVAAHDGECAFSYGVCFPEKKPTTCDECGGPYGGHVVLPKPCSRLDFDRMRD